jgi:hypothetical protein
MWMIALAERSSSVESLGTFRSFTRGGEPASGAASSLPAQPRHSTGDRAQRHRSRDALERVSLPVRTRRRRRWFLGDSFIRA